jgi:hypothetical protein
MDWTCPLWTLGLLIFRYDLPHDGTIMFSHKPDIRAFSGSVPCQAEKGPAKYGEVLILARERKLTVSNRCEKPTK